MSMPADAVLSAGRLTTSLSASDGGITFHRPTVSDRTDRLTSALDMLEAELGRLRERLAPVVSEQEGPSPQQGVLADLAPAAKEPGPDSWLAAKLAEATARVLLISRTLGAVTERIDL